ncbi:MAG: IPT/TIG domain-containing protein [Thermoguttaceae bacterium]
MARFLSRANEQSWKRIPKKETALTRLSGYWRSLRMEMLEDRRLLSAIPQPQLLSSLPVSAQQAISSAIGQDQSAYHAISGLTGVNLANPANGFTAQMQSGALQVWAGSDTWDMSLVGLSYGGAVKPVGTAQTTAVGNQVDLNYATIKEWYINGPGGLEQGFNVAPPQAQAGDSLTVELALGGDLTGTVNAAGDGLTLTRPDGSTALGYTGLRAYDATGKALPASLQMQTDAGRQELLIHVDDAGAQGPITIDPFLQEAKLTASDGEAGDSFGDSVAISGNTVVVGAEYATVGGNSLQGAAYVFTDSGGSTWTQVDKLTASDGMANDRFGASVAISGNTILVGAPHAAVGGTSDQGAVYVFTESGSTWIPAAKLTASDSDSAEPGGEFGISVAISGNTVVVGSIYAYVPGNYAQGVAYVFTGSGSNWNETGVLVRSAASAYDNFGAAVAISGSTIVVGADGAANGGNQLGAAYVFAESGSTWSQTAELTESGGSTADLFGSSVSIDGNTIVVGADADTVGSNADQGAAYVFTGSGSTWTPAAKLTASDGASDGYFGSAVVISGTTIVVGADPLAGNKPYQGAAYLFTGSGSTWNQTAKLTASDGGQGDGFGGSIGIDGSTPVIGSDGANGGQGAAYVFGTQTSVASVSPAVGATTGGTAVTITGSGFTGATQVDFGGVPAKNVVVVSDSQVTATSPAGSVGTVNVTVVKPGISSGISPEDEFRYLAAPVVTGISPTAGPLAGTTPVSITGTAFSDATQVYFGTTAALSVVINSTTQITATSPAGTPGTVDVTIVTPGGTSAVSAADQFSYLVAPPAELTASDGAANSGFGSSVSISGNIMAVGADGATVGGNSGQGAVYIFTKSGGVWTQTAEVTAPDGAAGDSFGDAVAVSGNILVVGAEDAAVGGNSDQGAVYIFTESGSTWSETAKLTASDGAAGDYFGNALSVSGSTLVIGAPDAAVGGNSDQGAAYVFTESGSTWTQATKLTASDGAAGNYFGDSVSVSGNTVVVGASGATIGANSYQGAAYVFTESGSAWSQAAKLTASDGAVYNDFGSSVSLSGATVVVGALFATIGGNSYQGAAYVFAESGSAWSQTAKLTASDGTANSGFGSSVSLSGNAVVVGAADATVRGNSDQGTAYAFTESGSDWNQTAEFTAPDGAAGYWYGSSVSVSGSAAAIGSPGATVGGNSLEGSAYVQAWPLVSVTGVRPPSGPATGGTTVTITGSGFSGATQVDFGMVAATNVVVDSDTQITATSPAGTGTVDVTVVTPGIASVTSPADQFNYSPPSMITTSDSGVSDFGSSVSISGNLMVVGADEGFSAAYVFTESGSVWTQTAKLTASGAGANSSFGDSVSISGNTIVVGAYDANRAQGAAYVFTESGSTWTQTAELTASDGAVGDVFGSSVSISGNTIVVGSPLATVAGNNEEGEAYVFTQSGSAWTQTAILTEPNGMSDDRFGCSVSVSNSSIVVGAEFAFVGPPFQQLSFEGAAYVFTGSGSNWAETAKLTASDGVEDAYFGSSVSINGNSIVVSAPNETVGSNSGQGAAYVFTGAGANWTQAAKLTASDGTAGAGFGEAGIDGNMIAVEGGGNVYEFEESGTTWNQVANLTEPNGAASDEFGYSVSISGGAVVVGAEGTVVGNGDGAAYVYWSTTSVSGVSPASGSAGGGTTVTITGTGFTGATAVDFGMVAATNVQVNSAGTQITATAPAGTGIVDITVVTAGGISNVSPADRFTYVAVPAVTGVGPTEGPAAGGTPMTITGSGFTGATEVYFGTVAASYFLVNSDTQITDVSPPGTVGTVNVTVATAGGTSPDSAADEFSYSLAPVVSGVSPAVGSVLGGTTVTISGTGFTGATAVDFGTVAASSFQINSSTQITATSEAGMVGLFDITVRTPQGTSLASPADQFSYEPVPTVTGVSPASGSGLGGTTVTITGTGFIAGAT